MENKLRFLSAAEYFEEALPLGNGSLGAMVYGKCDKERISLNHDTLWSGKPRRYSRENAYEAYRLAQKLMLEDKPTEASALLERDFTADFGQSYLPLGNLYIERMGAGEAQEYSRDLDMEKGIATVRYTEGGIRFEREYFVSHPDNCLVVHITSDKPASYVISADSLLKYAVTVKCGEICLAGECPTDISPEYAKSLKPLVYDGDGIKFSAIGVASSNGKLSSEASSVVIEDCTELTFVLCVETSYISFDVLPERKCYYPCEERTFAVSQKAYEDLKKAHIDDFSSYYNRVKLDLSFAESTLPTDERIKYPDKSADLGLVELLFNFGRYLVIASSREDSQATNLQGIWNEKLYAPWSSNYTVNINTEMNYWPVLMCNLAGMDMPIIELIKKISVTGADAARDFYRGKGYCSHHNVDLWGLATPVGAQISGSVRYSFWNMSSGWLCRHAWEHYEYTLDREYLEKTAYPLMKGAAEFYLSVMIWDDGKYILCPATSPENDYIHAENERVSVARYSAMSQAILMDLFGNISRAADILGIDDDFVREIREKLPLLNTYAIGSEGQLLEYDRDFAESDIHHRHTSHLYGLYPGESITTQSSPELAEACRKTLLRRGDISTGWSMGWRVNFWAKLKDGNHALTLVKNQLTAVPPTETRSWRGGGSYPNLFDAHPPFQIDGNFGVCAGIVQMFLQCEDGKIRLLPALPDDFANGSVSGLLAKGCVTVYISWENGKLKAYSLTSPFSQTVTVATPTEEREIALTAGKTFVFEKNE